LDDGNGVFSQNPEPRLPGTVQRGCQPVVPSTEIVRPSQKALAESQEALAEILRPSQSILIYPSVLLPLITTPAATQAQRRNQPGPPTSALSPHEAPIPLPKMRRAGSTLTKLKEVIASEEKTYILQGLPKAAGPIGKAVRKYRPVSVLGEREIG